MFKFIKLTHFSLVLIDVSPYPLYSFGESINQVKIEYQSNSSYRLNDDLRVY